jgi:hypothetical protein
MKNNSIDVIVRIPVETDHRSALKPITIPF